jgi:ribosomal protein L16/L10AE
MDNDMIGFWLVVAVVIFAAAGSAVFSVSVVPGATWQQARQALQQCEAQLPRDMHCVVTAVPE